MDSEEDYSQMTKEEIVAQMRRSDNLLKDVSERLTHLDHDGDLFSQTFCPDSWLESVDVRGFGLDDCEVREVWDQYVLCFQAAQKARRSLKSVISSIHQ